MKLAAFTLLALIAGLLSIERAGQLRSGRWAVAGLLLLVLAFSLDLLLARII